MKCDDFLVLQNLFILLNTAQTAFNADDREALLNAYRSIACLSHNRSFRLANELHGSCPLSSIPQITAKCRELTSAPTDPAQP